MTGEVILFPYERTRPPPLRRPRFSNDPRRSSAASSTMPASGLRPHDIAPLLIGMGADADCPCDCPWPGDAA